MTHLTPRESNGVSGSSLRDELVARRKAFRAKMELKPEQIPPPIPVTIEDRVAALEEKVAELEIPLPGPAMIKRIQHIVADHFGVPVIDMVSQRRTASVVRPRQIAMYLSRLLTLRSLPEIGRRFGGRDHTTVMHGVRKIEYLITGTYCPAQKRYPPTSPDALLAAEIEMIKEKVGA